MEDLDPPISRETTREHLAALAVLRHAKNVFIWLAACAVVLHVLLWIIVRYTDLPDSTGRWEPGLDRVLGMAGFVGRASVLVVTGVFIVVLLISLTSKLGGTAGLARACVWALAALAMLVPWTRIAPEDVAGIPSALYGMDELAKRAGETGGLEAFLAVVRFAVCPLLVGAFLGLAQYHFRGAYRKITSVPTAKLPIREV
jgi:hypothetical protein